MPATHLPMRCRRCGSCSPRAHSSTKGCAPGTSTSPVPWARDHGDKWHFEFKAVDAAKGELVLPDAVESRWLAADRAEELAAARARLLAALDQSGRDKAPEPAARAQVAFDCWLEQAVWNAEDEPHLQAAVRDGNRRGRAGAHDRGRRLSGVLRLGSGGPHAGHAGRARSGRRRLQAEAAPSRVVIAGHADRSGTEAYNEELSEQRARNVARALVARGVPQAALGRAVVRREPAADRDARRGARAAEPPGGDRVRRSPLGVVQDSPAAEPIGPVSWPAQETRSDRSAPSSGDACRPSGPQNRAPGPSATRRQSPSRTAKRSERPAFRRRPKTRDAIAGPRGRSSIGDGRPFERLRAIARPPPSAVRPLAGGVHVDPAASVLPLDASKTFVGVECHPLR